MVPADHDALPASLAESTTTARQRRWAAVFAVMLTLFAAAGLSTVGRPLPSINGPSFFTAYDALSAAIAWSTAFLLVSQFEQTRSVRLLALAMAFTFMGGIAAAHMLTIPGLLLHEPLFGNDNTTLWLRVAWLSALPIGALVHLAAHSPRVQSSVWHADPRPLSVAGLMLAALLAVAALVVATTARNVLPDLTPRPENFGNTYYVVLPALVALQVLALVLLLRKDRLQSALGLWLSLALFAVLIETTVGWLLVGILPDRRYSLNFYMARAAGMISGSVVFLALLAQVGRCYRQLADAGSALRGRVRELSTSEARLAAIVSSTSEAILSKSLDGTITSWNEAAERLFGYTSGEVVGRSVRELIPEARQRDEDEVLARIVAGEHVETYETERLDRWGRIVEVSLTASPLCVDGRLIGASSIMHDIRARKRREEHDALLLREVNHRSKNLLAVVQAIARQTVNASPQSFLASFSDRIGALGASHDLLIESRWQGVDLGDLVRAELGRFQQLVGKRIVIAGPALRLTPHAAQTIGMALHELATNAGKHGALSTDAGRVEITWRCGGISGNGRLVMHWEERGGPPALAPQRHGFGTVLIRDVPRSALKAEVDLTFGADGLAWSLDAPAAGTIETDAAPPDSPAADFAGNPPS